MTSTDYKHINGSGLSHLMTKIKQAIAATVTGVKGNAESSYRTGQVNITAANVGAVDKSGDTMTGTLTLVGGRYTDDNATAALKLQNSNIIGVNSIYTADLSDNAQEGIHFYRDSTHVDSIHAKNGMLYFTPNRQLGTNGTSIEVVTAGSSTLIPYGSELMTTNPFAPARHGKAFYVSKIDNALYCADRRWAVDVVNNSGGNASALFDGNYETRLQAADGETMVITMDFSRGSEAQSNGYFPGYPYGEIIVSSYYLAHPESITGRVYCNYASQGVGWHDLSFAAMDGSTNTATSWVARQSYYNISKIEISVTGKYHDTTYQTGDITQIEFFLDRPIPTKNPFITKYGAEKLYYDLTAPKFIGALQGDLRSVTPRVKNANTAPEDSTALRHYLATSAMTSGKPMGDGHIIEMEWDNTGGWKSQLYVPTDQPSNKHIQWRGQSGGSWTPWTTVFDNASVIPAANGGTGQTSLVNSANALINALSTGSSDPTDADYYISQYVGGGTTTTTYHRRPMSALWNYIKGKFKATMLSSATNSSSEELAATPKAVKAAYDLANTASTTAGQAMSAATGALAFKVTYSVEDGAVTCYAHVYSAGAEVTENYEDECFDWSMTLDGGTSWVVLGTGRDMPLTAMTAFGGNVKCDFTPPES